MSTQDTRSIDLIVTEAVAAGRMAANRPPDSDQLKKANLDKEIAEYFKDAKAMFLHGMAALKEKMPDADLHVTEMTDNIHTAINFVISDKLGSYCDVHFTDFGYFQAHDYNARGYSWVLDTAGQNDEKAGKNIIDYVGRAMSRQFEVRSRALQNHLIAK